MAAWYERAAQLGHVEAQFQLGLIFHYGVGALVGPNRPEMWRRSLSSRQGERASNLLALVFPHGTSVEKNPEAAFGWMAAAATAGKAEAQALLGDMYTHGQGCELDLAAAVVQIA